MTSLFNQQLQEQRRFIQLVTMENLPEVLLYNGYICKKNANISIFFKVEDKEAGTFWFNDGCPNEFTYVAGGDMVEGSTTYTNIHDYMMDGGMDELETMPAKDYSNSVKMIQSQLNALLVELNKEVEALNNKLEYECFPYLGGWFRNQIKCLETLANHCIAKSPYNATTEKLELTKDVMLYIERLHKADHRTSKALYDADIDIINFELFTGGIQRILNTAYDATTVDYIGTYLYEYDCCASMPIELSWVDERGAAHEYVINDVGSLIGYLDEHVYLKGNQND